MDNKQQFDVIIIGGSYSGLAAGMALGRALRKVLIIDSGKPCNAQTPHSHNFLTQDGQTPATIAEAGRAQVKRYSTVSFLNGVAVKAEKKDDIFEVEIASGETFNANKLIFATGIRDLLPAIKGIADCWGITVLHCPFCHGYEVRNKKTAVIANGQDGFDTAMLISNWTNDLTLFTNGTSSLNQEQVKRLAAHNIRIIETPVSALEHTSGYVESILLKDNSRIKFTAAYIRSPFRQACALPEFLGCTLNDDGYIQVDTSFATTVPGVFACGDNVSRMRTVANSVANGTAVGITVSRLLISERF